MNTDWRERAKEVGSITKLCEEMHEEILRLRAEIELLKTKISKMYGVETIQQLQSAQAANARLRAALEKIIGEAKDSGNLEIYNWGAPLRRIVTLCSDALSNPDGKELLEAVRIAMEAIKAGLAFMPSALEKPTWRGDDAILLCQRALEALKKALGEA